MKYLLILFATIILALIVTGCIDVELEYEKTNEGEKLLEDNSKMNHDDLLIQTMQATKKDMMKNMNQSRNKNNQKLKN